MSAVSAVLSAIGRVRPGARVAAPAGAYGETLEAIAARGIGIEPELVPADCSFAVGATGRPRVLLVDSFAPGGFAAPDLRNRCDLVLFDTSCLWSGSGRIRRVLYSAGLTAVPIALVRSHTKLDSLGIEYGRLGSVVLHAPLWTDPKRHAWLEGLDQEIKRAIRLSGTAPVPLHFPPFAGHPRHAELSAKRIARIIANGRNITRRLIGHGIPVASCRHGLYGVLRAPDLWAREDAMSVAGRLVDGLCRAALPVRHAGSFGFDFFAMDVFPDGAGEHAPEKHGVRLAFSDVPGPVALEVSDQIAAWWTANVLPGHAGRRAA